MLPDREKSMKNKDRKKKGFLVEIIFLCLALLSVLYFSVLVSYIGFASKGNYVWLIIGIFFFVAAFAIKICRDKHLVLPHLFNVIMWTVIICAAVLFAAVEGMIIYNATKQPKPDADYVLVLGAKVNGSTPSRSLMMRINKAEEYLNKNEQSIVIVCGGQGADEQVSEAYAMKETLISGGIDESRIIMEDKSVNTNENIKNAIEFIEDKESEVVITTSSFHVFRALGIARKAGLKNVSGNPSESVVWLIPQDYVREFFAVVKDFVFGNM